MNRVLFVASEAYPLIKTGGLADVAGSLPEALRDAGVDVRLLLPAYADVLAALPGPAPEIARLTLQHSEVGLRQCLLPGTGVTTWLLDCPEFSARHGNPYQDPAGHPWADNAERFALLSRAAVQICSGVDELGWRPDILHCNDWHTGPAVALAQGLPAPPVTVFTVHSLAHMGIFDYATFERLGLPGHLWAENGLEFYGQCSFIKGGLVFADYVTTVSPTYAEEIRHRPGGLGLEGLLSRLGGRLVGILNGVDGHTWDPQTDPCLAQKYGPASLDDKALNRVALQRELGLAVRDDRPLLGFVGRLVEQKGLELMLPVLEQLLDSPVQLAFLGTGETRYEDALSAFASAHPAEVGVVLEYNEELAHRIEAGADIFLMPSLFEPCGLNQMYSQLYGTLPVVRRVGGLADTVVDATQEHLESGRATGFVFDEPDAAAFLQAAQRAVDLWRDRQTWRRMQTAAMDQDFSWQSSAQRYLALYRSVPVH